MERKGILLQNVSSGGCEISILAVNVDVKASISAVKVLFYRQIVSKERHVNLA